VDDFSLQDPWQAPPPGPRRAVPLRQLRRARLGVPLFQAATANLNPWTEVKVDIDGGWREVADTALAFGKRFA
jgi:hypothetical protein